LAETILALERLAREAGRGTVGTVGEIEVDPGLINAIAARVRFSLDVRGPVDEAYRGVAEAAAEFAQEAARRADRGRAGGGRGRDRRAVHEHALGSRSRHDVRRRARAQRDGLRPVQG